VTYEKGDRLKLHFVYRGVVRDVCYQVVEGTCTGKIVKLDAHVSDVYGSFTKQLRVEHVDEHITYEAALESFRKEMLNRKQHALDEAAKFDRLALAAPKLKDRRT
jgi:hypothetical protein